MGCMRIVTTAWTLTLPRLFQTRTQSPLLMPFSRASSSEISMKFAGMISFNHGMLRVCVPDCQCSTTE